MSKQNSKNIFFNKFIEVIEIIGNKLPHPFWLFTFLCILTLIASTFFSYLGTSVEYLSAQAEGAEMMIVKVQNLLSYAEMREFLSNLVKTYITFPPLGLVVVMMMGVAFIEQTGLLSSLIRKMILKAPSYIVTSILIFIGINSSIASDAGILFTPTIGAVIFKALGRNPWIGIITGYAAASGGLSASLFISSTDVVLAGITESAAKAMNILGATSPVINWYFMSAMTIVLTIVLTIVTEKILVKILDEPFSTNIEKNEKLKYELTKNENRGLFYAGISFIIFIFIILYLSIPINSFFRNDIGTFLPKSPLMSSILPIIFSIFFISGTAYGIGAKTITKLEDIPKLMQKQLNGMTSILVTMFPASMFVYLFGRSKLAVIIAVKGADRIKNLEIGAVPLIILLVLLCTLLNLFIGSASAKWLILAPIFVPMFSIVGFSPALTQAAYRIGDGGTNIISPIAGAVPIILGLLEQYKSENYNKKIGVGTMISLELPFSITLIVIQTGALILWLIFNIPLGPNANVLI